MRVLPTKRGGFNVLRCIDYNSQHLQALMFGSVFKTDILKCGDLPGNIKVLFTCKPQLNSANGKNFTELFEGNVDGNNHSQTLPFELADIWPNALHHYSSVKCYLCFASLISNWFHFRLFKLGRSQWKVCPSRFQLPGVVAGGYRQRRTTKVMTTVRPPYFYSPEWGRSDAGGGHHALYLEQGSAGRPHYSWHILTTHHYS